MEPNKVPLDFCHRWIYGSIKLGERHYTLFLICGLIMAISLVITKAIPYVGSISYMILSFLYVMGAMRMTDHTLQHGKASVDDFLKYTFDTSYFQRFSVQLIALVGLGVFLLLATYLNLFFTALASTALSTIMTQLLTFSAFMMWRNPSLHWKEAFERIFNGFSLNLGTWLISLLLLALFATLTIILCLAPFLLYFVPMTFGVTYMIYASIYENLDIESLITEWSSKPPIETHTLPSEEA